MFFFSVLKSSVFSTIERNNALLCDYHRLVIMLNSQYVKIAPESQTRMHYTADKQTDGQRGPNTFFKFKADVSALRCPAFSRETVVFTNGNT